MLNQYKEINVFEINMQCLYIKEQNFQVLVKHSYPSQLFNINKNHFYYRPVQRNLIQSARFYLTIIISTMVRLVSKRQRKFHKTCKGTSKMVVNCTKRQKEKTNLFLLRGHSQITPVFNK